MKTSFQHWLESRDPELFTILEAEWRRRDRKPGRSLVAGAAAAAAALGIGAWMSRGGDKPADEEKPNAPTVTAVQKQETNSAPGKYNGPDAERIFRYACEQSHNGVNIFPYYVGGKQQGLIARVSLPATSTSPLSDRDLKDRYYSFVSQIRATMGGRNVLKVDDAVAGQGQVTWEYIAIGRDNPNRSEAGMTEIVLYAKKPVGE